MGNRNPAATVSYVIFEKEGKILLAKRQNTGWRDGYYQMPAGHIETGELPSEAAIREMHEEVGVVIAKEDLKFVHIGFRTKQDETGDRVDYYFLVTRWEGEVVNNEPQKCSELLWVTLDALPENTVPNARHVLEAIQRNEVYSELR